MRVTYAVTVFDEIQELRRLIGLLVEFVRDGDEIIVQYDEPNVSQAVLDYLALIAPSYAFLRIIPFALNNDFAAFRNHLNDQSAGDYIFQIDADEIPGRSLLDQLHSILTDHSQYELFVLSRVNTVAGITHDHVRKWGWAIDINGWINFPDLQDRIYRNSPHLRWTGAVHEKLTGCDFRVGLPATLEFGLYHPKTLERQERQLQLYEAIRKSA